MGYFSGSVALENQKIWKIELMPSFRDHSYGNPNLAKLKLSEYFNSLLKILHYNVSRDCIKIAWIL